MYPNILLLMNVTSVCCSHYPKCLLSAAVTIRSVCYLLQSLSEVSAICCRHYLKCLLSNEQNLLMMAKSCKKYGPTYFISWRKTLLMDKKSITVLTRVSGFEQFKIALIPGSRDFPGNFIFLIKPPEFNI